jgi:hypothetical protein
VSEYKFYLPTNSEDKLYQATDSLVKQLLKQIDLEILRQLHIAAKTNK